MASKKTKTARPAGKTVKKAISKKKVAKKVTRKKTAVKKASRKTAPKKKTKKITTRSKKNAKKMTGPNTRLPVVKVIEPDQYFWVNYGPVIRDVYELSEALKSMSDEQYFHHTRREPGCNDFECWIRDVIGNEALAQRLARARTRTGARRVVLTYVSSHHG